MAKQQYGITVSSKDGARSATEWFTSEVERDQFYAWYTYHKRVCVRVQRDDEQAAAREKEQALADQRRHELAVAHAGRSSYRGGDTYSNFSSGASTGLGAGVGLALGVALGGLF